MTISELIETLQELETKLGGDVEVRYAHQPNYPLEYSIRGVAFVEEGMEYENENDPDRTETADNSVVYIGEGSQYGCLPTVATRALQGEGIW